MSCPLIARQQGLTIVYIFFILSTVCGTITNTTIFTMTPDDSFLLNTAGVNAARYYFGRIVYRMVMDAVFGGIALLSILGNIVIIPFIGIIMNLSIFSILLFEINFKFLYICFFFFFCCFQWFKDTNLKANHNRTPFPDTCITLFPMVQRY